MGERFRFHFIADDWSGKRTEFTAPVIFFNYNQRRNLQSIETVRDAYRDSGEWRRNFSGQKIAFAPETEPGDTDVEAAFLYFSAYPDPHPSAPSPSPIALALSSTVDAVPPADTQGVCCANPRPLAPRTPPFKPHVPKAEVKVPAAAGLGKSGANTVVPIEWDDDYLRNGFTGPGLPNFGEVFAKLADDFRLPFDLPDVRGVGLFKPNFNLSHLSRKFGGVGGDIDLLKNGTIDFASLFPSGLGAKFLGSFDLGEFFGSADFSKLGGSVVPKVKTRVFNDAAGIPERVEAYMDWQPRLEKKTVAVATFIPSDRARAHMEVVVSTSTRDGNSSFRLIGLLDHVQLEIANAIRINFNRLSFTAEQGHGPRVQVDLGTVEFLGGLAFFAKLQEKLGSTLFGAHGPRIALEGANLVATAGFALPNISIGVFALQHLRLATKLILPLAGDRPLSVGIDVGARHDPFLVSVTIFGGGGHLSVTIGPPGIVRVELSIQAGGVAALEFGVANGSAYFLIGVGMLFDRSPEGQKQGLVLQLFLRAGGSLNVLGLVTVSLEFTLMFSCTRLARARCAPSAP